MLCLLRAVAIASAMTIIDVSDAVPDPDHEFDFRGCTGGLSWQFPSSQTSYYFATATDFVLPSQWTIETWVKPTDLLCSGAGGDYCYWLSWAVGTQTNANCMLLDAEMFDTSGEWQV